MRERQRISFVSAPTRTKQSFKDECDVNNIMKKWRVSGELSHLTNVNPTYGDFSNVDDYLEASNKVLQAEADFAGLSARIRDRMDNDPAELLRFMADPNNLDEAVALGLISKPAATPTSPVAGSKEESAAAADAVAKQHSSKTSDEPGPSPVSGGE